MDFVDQLLLTFLAGNVPNASKQDGCSGESLLAVNDVEGRVLARLRQPRDKDEKAHEVIALLFWLLDLLQTLPEFGPLLSLPAVVSLEDRNHVLARRVQNLAHSLDGGFHAMPWESTRLPTSLTIRSPEMSFGSSVSRR